MILVIEGLEGAGKTTLATRVAKKLGIRLFKPFRDDEGTHWGTHTVRERALHRMGVPINTHVEDLFMADFLAQYPEADAVLDRGMPSAIAYGVVDGIIQPDRAMVIFEYWLETLRARNDLYYIELCCDPAVAEKRSPGRVQPPPRRAEIQSQLDDCYKRIGKSAKNSIRLNTAPDDGPDYTYEFVMRNFLGVEP